MAKRFFFWTVLIGLASVAAAYLVVSVRDHSETANRMRCAGKLKQLGLALLNFQEIYGCLPPAYIPDERGRPMHSWRVLILEIMEREDIYQKYDFSEPWNGPNNARLAAQLNHHDLNWLQCPSEDQTDPLWTSYVAVVGRHTLWPGPSPGQVTNAAAGKILLLEVANSGIHWMEPRDLTLEQALAVAPSIGLTASSRHPMGIQYVTAEDQVGIWSSQLGTQSLSDMLVIDTRESIIAPHREDPALTVRQFLNCAVSRVPFFRLRAVDMLARFRREPEKFMPHLTQAINDQRADVRAVAVDALNKIKAEGQKKN